MVIIAYKRIASKALLNSNEIDPYLYNQQVLS